MKKKWVIIIALITLSLTIPTVWLSISFLTPKKTIKIGILHSLTGSLAASELPMVDAAMLAITEINAAGGVMGRKIEPIIADGKTDETVFATEAERLITQENVVAIFGCWTIPSRKAVRDVVEKYKNLLFYPLQFEGLEDSPNVIYTSTTPNQQAIPGTIWCIQNLGKRFFLVGSDPFTDEIIKDTLHAYGGEVVGQEYISLTDTNLDPIIKKIVTAKPDVIINNIEGNTNLKFFTALRKAGISPEKIPTMSFSISESELQLFNTNSMTGDYATWSYFQSIDRPENRLFIKKIKAHYGEKHVVDDPMEAAYYSIYFWKQAVEKAGSTNTDNVRQGLKNQAFNAPQGVIHMNGEGHYVWQCVKVGKIRSDKQFTIVWDSKKTVKTVPYPPTRSREEWEKLLAYWYEKWGKKWSDS